MTRIALSSVVALMTAGAAYPQDRDPDFLFGVPRGSIGVRGGYLIASAEGEVFDFFNDILTVERSDFNAPVFGVDFAMTLHSRIDAVFGVEISRAGVTSEYRDYVEDNDLPIVQQTKLTVVPVTASVKLYVTPRGREVSRFAFVPSKASVYVGGGGGVVWYRLEQIGDFVDFEDLSIFTSQLLSDGWGLETHVFSGVDIRLRPKLVLSVELRYLWGDAGLDGDFFGFAPIDLGGLRTTAGIHVSF